MITTCKLLCMIIYKNFQILTQPLLFQNCSLSVPVNLKWTAQELFSCKHSLRDPATEAMQMSGKQQEARGWLEQVSARTYPLTLKKISAKVTIMGCWDTFPSLLPLPGTALF